MPSLTLCENWEVYIINLPQHTHRVAFNKQQLKKYGCGDTWKFYVAKKHTDLKDFPQMTPPVIFTNGQIGCALSHYSLWQHIAAHCSKPVLILEDDTSFTDWIKHVHNIPEISQVPWDILYLGHTPFIDPRNHCSRFPSPEYTAGTKVGKHILRFAKESPPIGMWAYFITPQAARNYVAKYTMTEPIDVFLGKQDNIYGVVPAVFLHCDPFESSTSCNASTSICNAPLVTVIIALIFSVAFTVLYMLPSGLTFRKVRQAVILPCLVLCWIAVLGTSGWYCIMNYGTHCRYIIARSKVQQLRELRGLRSSTEHVKNLHGLHYRFNAFDPFTNIWTDESKAMVRAILEQLRQQGTPFWLCKGSLLGLVRHQGQPIPWHDRVTVMMKCPGDKGFKLALKGHKWPFVSVCPLVVLDDKKIRVEGFDYHSVYPIPSHTAMFLDVPVEAPIDVREWLRPYSDWQTRYRSSTFDHRLGKPIHKAFHQNVAIEDMPVL